MTLIQEKLINAYTILILAGRKTIDDVPTTPITLVDGITQSTIRKEVEIKVSERIIEVLG